MPAQTEVGIGREKPQRDIDFDLLDQYMQLSGRVLAFEDYARHTLEVARDLLGKYLVKDNGETIVGMIVEVEAYRGEDDPASYAYKGKTPRSERMFDRPGLAYVIKFRGEYYGFNVVTESEQVPGAVLIRAVEPIRGLETIKQNRALKNGTIKDLTNGPAKVVDAFGLSGDDGVDLTEGKGLYIVDPNIGKEIEILQDVRVGVRNGKDMPWRFFIKGNPFVSAK